MKRMIAALAFALLSFAPAFAQAPGGFVDSYTFRREAAISDQFEIRSSQLALDRAASPAVVAFAQQMISDHTTNSAGLRQYSDFGASEQGVDPRRAAMLSELASLDGRAFDEAYAEMQVTAHQEAVALYGTYAQNGDWPELVGFARAALPGLQGHLRMATRLSSRR
jgi:putative membrane protein